MPRIRNLQDLKNHAEMFNITARFDALPEKSFPLTIKEVAAQATASNTYPITATMLPQRDLRILPGMSVTVAVDYEGDDTKPANDGKYSVPVTSILSEGGNNYVWRFAVGQVSRVPVTVGQIHDGGYVDIEGDTLSGGDVIVTAGVYFLHEGQRVRLAED